LLRSNLLMLDEPTNHLDISSVELLALSMQMYEGTFIVISHDRHFLAKVANKIWYIEDYEIKEYPGTYAEWEAWMKRRADAARANAEPTKPKKVAEPVAVVEQPKAPEQTAEQQKQNKNRLKKLQHELEAIEADITKLEDEKFHLEQELAKPEVSADFARLNKGMEQVKVLQQKIAQLMVKWEAQAAEIEKG
jgi:ATP-binding cassette subfamily F protein 3